MRVEVSPDAAGFLAARGGRLWVWAAYPRRCCAGVPAYMHAATEPPANPAGFISMQTAGLNVWYRIDRKSVV